MESVIARTYNPLGATLATEIASLLDRWSCRSSPRPPPSPGVVWSFGAVLARLADDADAFPYLI